MGKNSGVIGLLLVAISMAVGIFSGDNVNLGGFIDIGSVVIVIGGTIAGTLIVFSLETLKSAATPLKIALTRNSIDRMEILFQLMKLGLKSRKEGVLSLEKDIKDIESEYFSKVLQLVVDGTEEDILVAVAESEIEQMEVRHKKAQEIFAYMGEIAPAFGMIGTLIGLVLMLGALDNPDAIGPGMAKALLTTLYGAVLANGIFIPISKKLKNMSEEEINLRQAILQGVLDIKNGESPAMMEEKLKSFLSPKMKEEFDSRKKQARNNG